MLLKVTSWWTCKKNGGASWRKLSETRRILEVKSQEKDERKEHILLPSQVDEMKQSTEIDS
jgi:hypothetical protein